MPNFASPASAREQRRDRLSRYVRLTHIGTEKERLYVHLDDLLKFLMNIKGIRFSASLYEELLERELNDRVIGKVDFTAEVYASILDYCWELAKYCTSEYNKKMKLQQKDIEKNTLAKNRMSRQEWEKMTAGFGLGSAVITSEEFKRKLAAGTLTEEDRRAYAAQMRKLSQRPAF